MSKKELNELILNFQRIKGEDFYQSIEVEPWSYSSLAFEKVNKFFYYSVIISTYIYQNVVIMTSLISMLLICQTWPLFININKVDIVKVISVIICR